MPTFRGRKMLSDFSIKQINEILRMICWLLNLSREWQRLNGKIKLNKKTILCKNVSSAICRKQRPRSACASAQHYENMPIQIYWKFYHQKMKIWDKKKSDIFHISAQNINCGYSLEPSRRGGSNEYPQSMFWAEIRKILYTPVNPSFTI